MKRAMRSQISGGARCEAGSSTKWICTHITTNFSDSPFRSEYIRELWNEKSAALRITRGEGHTHRVEDIKEECTERQELNEERTNLIPPLADAPGYATRKALSTGMSRVTGR